MKAFLFLFSLLTVLPSSLLASKEQVILEQICHGLASSAEYNSCMAFIQSVNSSTEPTDIGDAINNLIEFINQIVAKIEDDLKLGNLTEAVKEALESCYGNFQNAKNDVQAAIGDISSRNFLDAIGQLKQVIKEAKSCDDSLSNAGEGLRNLKTAWAIGRLVARIIVLIIL